MMMNHGGVSQAGLFSGNLGWLPTTVANTLLYRNNSITCRIFPGVQLFNAYADLIMDGGISAFTAATGDLNAAAYDRFLKKFFIEKLSITYYLEIL